MAEFDVNEFYMIEYVCSECSNICSKDDTECPICGNVQIDRKTVCRSCQRYRYCPDPDCGFASHEDIAVCPKCGRKTKGSVSLIREDHMGLPIPPESDCSGTLRDKDEGKRNVLIYYEFMERFSEMECQEQTEKHSFKGILKRLSGLFKKER